jgi:hypothetical protein
MGLQNIYDKGEPLLGRYWVKGRGMLQCFQIICTLVAYYDTLQRQNTEISKQIFPEKEYRGLSPNFHIHASVSDLYIPTIGLPVLLEEI